MLCSAEKIVKKIEDVVNPQTDKDEVALRANGVPGVFSVDTIYR